MKASWMQLNKSKKMIIMKRILIFIAAIAISTAAFAQGAQQLPNDPEVRVGKLDNGMTYYIRHNDKPAQRAEYYLATHVGAIQETPDQDGLAHFLEHMCFNGTKNFPGKSLLNYLQSIGASFGGNINASTGVEVTTYMLNNMPTTREGIIDTCLLVMHDYSHFVTCDPVEIDNERGVIIEERRTRRSAEWRLHEQSLPYYYGDSKYAGCTLIGSQENLESFKPESLTNFYKTWYRPDLQALIVVGDIDVDSIEAKIKSLFADIPAAENPKPKDVIMIPRNEEPLIGILTDPERSNSSIEILWKTEATPIEFNSTDMGFLTDLAKSIVYQIMAERFEDLRSKPDAPFLYASLGIGNLCETCEVTQVSTSFKDGEYEKALRAVLTEVERMRRYGFTASEIQRAKDNILSSYEKAVEAADTRKNSEFVWPLINNFFYNQSFLTPQIRLQLAQMMLTNLPDEIFNAVAKACIDDHSLTIIYKAPAKEGLSHPTEEQIAGILTEVQASEIEAPVETEVASEFVDPASLKGSKVTKELPGPCGSTVWMLKNGVKVIVLPTEYKKDQVIFSLSKDGGKTLLSNEELYSVEDNIFTLFNRNCGISKFSGTEVGKMLSGKNLSISTEINDIRHGFTGQSTPKDLETALQILYLNFADPRFDEEEFNLGISQIRAVLPNIINQPNFKFQNQMVRSIYGGNERMVLINEDVLEKASLATYEKIYRRLFSDAAGLTAVFVGNIDLETFKPMCEKYLGSIAKGKKATKWNLKNYPVPVKGEVINHFTTDMQTPKNTVFGQYSANIPYSVKAEITMNAVSYILDMIYTDTLREEEGGTYGAQAMTDIDYEPVESATLQFYFETNPTQCDKLIELAKQGIRKLAEEGPTQEQMTRTNEYFKKLVSEKRINNGYWSKCILENLRLGIDYDKEYEAAVGSLNPEKIKAAAQAFLTQGNYVEVVMSPDKVAERE